MRDEGLWLEPEEVAWFSAALETLTKYAGMARCSVPPSVPPMRVALESFLAGRAGSRLNATTRLLADLLADPDEVDAAEAADRLGVTVDAVRKACRSGRFRGVARKHRGRWMIPTVDIDGRRDGIE